MAYFRLRRLGEPSSSSQKRAWWDSARCASCVIGAVTLIYPSSDWLCRAPLRFLIDLEQLYATVESQIAEKCTIQAENLQLSARPVSPPPAAGTSVLPSANVQDPTLLANSLNATNIFIKLMKATSLPRQKLQITKPHHRHTHRTQESSPIRCEETASIYSHQITMPSVNKQTLRNGFGSTIRPIRPLKHSKQKQPHIAHQNLQFFDLKNLKNSLECLEKEQLIENSKQRKKQTSVPNRLPTDKKYRATEGSEKIQALISERKCAENTKKITFHIGNKPRSLQKTQEPQKLFNIVSPRKMLVFPRNERLKVEGEQCESHRSVSKYEKKLTPLEKQEIATYQLFYIGPRRIFRRSDFTDGEGDPKVMVQDSIAYRYEVISQLGRGSFGKVFKVFDHKKKEFVALKLIKCQKKFLEQAKVEVEILQTALLKDPKGRCNVVKMRSSFVFRGHSCITFEILHKNLYQFLKQHQFSGFSHDLIRRFAIQILQSLAFFKKNNIIHCDLKPENILLKEENKSGIRVIDVGSGCFQDKQLYTYIQSRFYRAPEIILGIRYTPAIDIWSFGCVMIELFTGFPIFPGESEKEQMLLVMEVLGLPPKEILLPAERRKKFFDDDFKCIIPQEGSKHREPGSVSLNDVLGSNDPDFVNFISRCLEWDPFKRLTPAEGLVHPWILKGLPEEIRGQHLEQMKEENSS